MGTLARAALAVALPAVVFFGGAWLMQVAGGRDGAALKGLPCPLNQRWRGYDTHAVAAQWAALKERERGLQIERRLLRIDLLFPVAYGAALVAGLLVALAGAGRPFHPAWAIALVLMGVVADWTENLTQLGQLARFEQHERDGLEASSIARASIATQVKLGALGLATGLLLILAAITALRGA